MYADASRKPAITHLSKHMMRKTNRPKSVRRAVALLWLSLAITVSQILLVIVPDFHRYSRNPFGLIALPFMLAMILAPLVVTIVGVSRGWSWARYLLVILVVGGCIGALTWPGYLQSLSIRKVTEFAIQVALRIGAICLIFSRGAGPWFRRIQIDHE